MADEKDDQAPGGQRPDATAAPAGAPRRMWVRSTIKPKEDGGNVIVLWERDPAHPGGEALISGPKPVEVGVTPAVSQRLRDGEIVQVAAPAKPAPAK